MLELLSPEPSPCQQPAASLSAFPSVSAPLGYEEFFREYLERNVPCVLSEGFTSGWRARRAWVTKAGAPDVDHLLHHFGEAKVPVADCDQKHYDSQEKKTSTLQEYIHYWNGLRKSSEGKQLCLYLKDWHFVQAYPEYDAYTTLQFFASDWLNEFWGVREDIQDDYQFVYIGPKGSWTPFHADVFRSYSWSTNICGRKRWVFYPPGEEQNLRDIYGTPVYDIDSPELRDSSQFPKAASASGRLEVIQEQGQTIFVPSGWYHQVWNLEDTISINHNWLNGTNIHIAWDFLVESVNQVENAIRDCSSMDEWPEQCQLLLKATHGMDYQEFYMLLCTIAHRRINMLQKNEEVISFGHWHLGRNHATYDLKRIQWCLEKLLDDPRLEELQVFTKMEEPPSQLLQEIVQTLS
ncbi:2-oxoglutarate and iron-dependent oxygenase JMJD4-like isoform X1 [Eriocheir sinensis]|uniref:2-oxoglutarate and iron-dependent oxygenase JMJD4-like isoform X1 n=1 Tax=Eriocheir sinensis TaxID=95602 RepID=UPI0021C885FC|nr:2-oxoglutarate and iron-dependent oxygenase JMJD4-like isoform X1 [Eriocheir sinensis]